MTLALPALRRSDTEPAVAETETRTGQLQTLCAVLAFVGLGYALMHSGGRERGTTEIALALAAPSLLAGRIWRTLPLLELFVSSCVATVCVVLPLVTGLGVSAARDLNAYTYAVVLYLALRAYTRDRERCRVVALAFLSLGVTEFYDVIPVWIGEQDPSYQVTGTFYWHNQFGIFAAAVALLASAMVMRSSRAEDAIAWLVAPVFLTLTWLSHSRAAILALVVTAFFLPGAALLRRQWWALLRAGCAVGLAVAVYGLMITAVSGTGHVGQGFSPARESLSSAQEFRLTATKEAAKVFERSPILSHGYGSLGVTGWQHVPAGTTTSPYAHSAEFQALSDGGLVLGVPVILAMALLAWRALRIGLQSVRRRAVPDWLPLGASLAGVALLLHASMDFDSQYPVVLGLLVALVAIVAPIRPATTTDRNLLRRLAVVLTVAATVFGGFLTSAYWQTSHRLDKAASLLSNDSARSVMIARAALDHHHFTDPRPAAFIVAADDLGYVFDDKTLRRALRESRTFAHLDPQFAPVWDRVNAEVLAASPPTGPKTTRR